MAYGLVNAPSVFQSFINKIFRDLLNKCVIAYIDDILVYLKSESKHWIHVKLVLSRQLESKLFVKAEKFEFHIKQTLSQI